MSTDAPTPHQEPDTSESEDGKRHKVFSGPVVAASGGLDENGIPHIAYDNTKGDTPVSAKPWRLDKFAYEVTYMRDEQPTTPPPTPEHSEIAQGTMNQLLWAIAELIGKEKLESRQYLADKVTIPRLTRLIATATAQARRETAAALCSGCAAWQKDRGYDGCATHAGSLAALGDGEVAG